MSIADGDSLPSGKVGTVAKNFTVNLPKDLLQATGWDWRSGPTLLAHLVQEGLIRLYLASELRHQVNALRAEIQRSDAPDRDDRLAVLADKYRDVELYTSSNQRVQLNGTIAAYLGIFRKGDRAVYIEARKGAIYIMSLSYRNQRLADFSEEIGIGES